MDFLNIIETEYKLCIMASEYKTPSDRVVLSTPMPTIKIMPSAYRCVTTHNLNVKWGYPHGVNHTCNIFTELVSLGFKTY